MTTKERKSRTTSRRTGLTMTLAVAAVTASAVTVAGPFCNNGYRGAGPYMQPYSPMGPGPQAYYGAPSRSMGAMTAPGSWRMPAYPANAQGYTQQAAPAPAGNSQKQAAMSADKDVSAPDKITVRIDGMRFEPSIITVEPGTTVTWIHNSSMPHTVTGQADRMQSKTMSKGQTYTYTFDTAGNFDYSCDFHPAMKGTVVVKGGGTRI